MDSSGRFQFSDAANPAQMTLFGHEPDVTALKRLSVVYICQLVHAVPWNVNPALPGTLAAFTPRPETRASANFDYLPYSCFNESKALTNRCAASSVSSLVVKRPKLNRMEDSACSTLSPMARRT